VLFSFATQNNVLTKALAGTLVAVVALSLMLTPLIMIVNDLLVQPRFVTSAPAREADAIDDNENPVIIAGFGRFGQIVRLLIAMVKATVLAIPVTCCGALASRCSTGMCPGLICYVRQGQNKPLFVVAIDDREKALNTVDLVHKHFPT